MTRDRRLIRRTYCIGFLYGEWSRKGYSEKRRMLQIVASAAVNAGRNEIFITLDSSLKLDLRLLDKVKPKYNMKASAANQWLQSNYWIVVSKSKSFYWK